MSIKEIKTALLVLAIVMSFWCSTLLKKPIGIHQRKKTYSRDYGLVKLSEKLSLFIHETQKERGMSAEVFRLFWKKIWGCLPKQRTLTDKTALKELVSYIDTMSVKGLPKELHTRIASLKEATSQLGAMRQRVDAQVLSLKKQ